MIGCDFVRSFFFFFFKQKTAYEMRISDWSSDVCSSDLAIAPTSPESAASDGTTFSPAALAEARATGKPVFVYFTADWCLSCKANEAGAIERAAVQTAFDKAGVVTLVGDWKIGRAHV